MFRNGGVLYILPTMIYFTPTNMQKTNYDESDIFSTLLKSAKALWPTMEKRLHVSLPFRFH